MAFNEKKFTVIGGQGRRKEAPQLFGYCTPDPIATVVAAGYFNPMSKTLFPGDGIMVSLVTVDTDGQITAATATEIVTVTAVDATAGTVAVVRQA